MNYPDYVDEDMRKLLDALNEVLVPRKKRKPVIKLHLHTPPYTRGRYTKF